MSAMLAISLTYNDARETMFESKKQCQRTNNIHREEELCNDGEKQYDEDGSTA